MKMVISFQSDTTGTRIHVISLESKIPCKRALHFYHAVFSSYIQYDLNGVEIYQTKGLSVNFLSVGVENLRVNRLFDGVIVGDAPCLSARRGRLGSRGPRGS